MMYGLNTLITSRNIENLPQTLGIHIFTLTFSITNIFWKVRELFLNLCSRKLSEAEHIRAGNTFPNHGV